LPDGVVFDTEPLRVNGRPVTLEKGANGRFFIPLTEANPDKPTLVDLRYTLKDNPGTSLALPVFTSDPAVLKVTLSVYLPDETALLGASGPWTDENRWYADRSWNWWTPHYPLSDDRLIDRLSEDIDISGNPTSGFKTDGTRYVFSTLRPTGPLQLTKVNETSLTWILLAILILGGLSLVTSPLKTRVLAVGTLVAVMLLCGVFAPLFARQVLDGHFLVAALVVLVIWAVVLAYRHQPRPWRPAAPTAPPTPPPAPDTSDDDPEKPSEKAAAPESNDEGGKTDA
jgi:hypothetical protein